MCPDIALTLPEVKEKNPYRVALYDAASDRLDWDKILKSADNATLFHTHEFLSYHPPDRFENHHLIFRTGEEPRIAFTGAVRKTDKGKALISYPGASYGGLVHPAGLSFHQAYHLVNTLLQYACGEGFKSLAMTPPPAVYSSWPEDVISFHLLRSGFRYLKREMTQVIALDYPGGDVFKTLCNKTRTAVRKALKSNLSFEEHIELNDANLEIFYPLLVDNRRRLGVTPTHSLEELKRLRDLIPDKLSLSLIRYKSRPVAGILNFVANARVLLVFYICHDWEYQELRPVPLLVCRTMEWAHKRGFRYLDFGTSTQNMDPNWGLIKFKENFGSLGYFRDTFTIDL